jgi:hypothetical protein
MPYTPSFGLMGHESLIMQQSDIGAIADSVKDCLRCGKCKPVCATHVPRANLLYSPRNKILATSLLVEAFSVRGADPPGHFHQTLGRVRGCGRPLHGVPQVPVALPGQDRLWRCVHEHAQPAAQDGPEVLPARQCGGHVLPGRQPGKTIKLARSAMVGVAFKAQRLANQVLQRAGPRADGQAPGHGGHRLPSKSR